MRWIFVLQGSPAERVTPITKQLEDHLPQLTHFSTVSHFYIPSKLQKTFGFLRFSEGMEM